jgi:beta-glucosidase-like glycosyl hydrolase/CubicO group peptidase (beta-lactamase class C family)
MKRIYIISLLIFSLFSSYSQDSLVKTITPAERWADSVMQTLSIEEMIGQLLVIRANTPNQEYYPVIDQYITKYNIGGVTFFGGHPTLQAIQTNKWQKLAKTPLFISIDGEWGPAMRLDSIMAFPYQMTLGAIVDDSIIYRMGLEVARQCKRLGIQINFAPDVDINSNPDNPVIHMRSFGENREDVARKGILYMKGMQDGGLIVTAKHFPGHGDTGSDSHYTLPVISHSRARLDSVELYPFRKLIEAGLDGIMIAHLNIPSLEKSPNTASTLSSSIVNDLLRNELGFNGLIVTDALDMKGVTLNNTPGDIELEALKAGNDILLLSANVPAAVNRIMTAIDSGEIQGDLVKERCRKILLYKYKAGLNNLKPVETKGLADDLSTPYTELLNRQLFEGSVTIVRNINNLIPLSNLDTLRIASVSSGHGAITAFQERLECYAPITGFALKKEPADSDLVALKESLKHFNLVIFAVQNTSIWGGKPYGISEKIVNFISELSKDKQVILDLFASPYALRLFENSVQPGAIVMSYQDHKLMQDVSAQAIFGGIPVSGRLPVTCGKLYPSGISIQTNAVRLKYTIPEELGIEKESLAPIDSMIKDAMEKKIFPGCQVWAAKDGKVFYMESFGYHTYTNEIQVKNNDAYDIASLTKVAASTLAVMRMVDEDKLDIDFQLQEYLPYLKGSGKGEIIIREMMAHQSKLTPWIPFYKYTMTDKKPDTAFYRSTISEDFPVRVAENMYIRKNYQYVIFDSILSSPMLKTSSYKYSDLGFYFIPEIMKNLVNKPFDEFLSLIFYKPLGLSTLGYLPRKRISLARIPPTELDTIYRMQLVHGDVHDQGAAMLGGISGHAGLFSDANDLGIIAQMLLQDGTYGNVNYLDSATIREFTEWQFPLNDNRRGIGFDKPLPEYTEEGPCCKSASPSSFGHSGFTGTYIWIDPASNLSYIFLSNRVYPDATNNKLAGSHLRAKIHQVFYDAIKKSATFAN